MFQYEARDANTASVVSEALGIPKGSLTVGKRNVLGKTVSINQSQLDDQVPYIEDLTKSVE